MKLKTQSVSGVVLDWAIAEALAKDAGRPLDLALWCEAYEHAGDGQYDRSWALTGDFVRKYGISFQEVRGRRTDGANVSNWDAYFSPVFRFQNYESRNQEYRASGPDHTTAALRAVVVYRLGPELDVPQEVVDFARRMAEGDEAPYRVNRDHGG